MTTWVLTDDLDRVMTGSELWGQDQLDQLAAFSNREDAERAARWYNDNGSPDIRVRTAELTLSHTGK
jgi:hypothetical protein